MSLTHRFEKFFLQPASAAPLAFLRIGLAALLLAQVYCLRFSSFELLSSEGFVQGALAQKLMDPYAPRMSSLMRWLSPWRISESFGISIMCWMFVGSLLFLLFGFKTRLASVASWLFHWLLINTAASTSYGVDLFAHVFLFYLMFMPAGEAYSVDAFLRGRVDQVSSWARLSLRVLQLHLCIAYLSSGLEKAKGIQWWNGEVLWRSLTLPEYKQFNMEWVAHFPWLMILGGWVTLLLEIGYCVFIWPQATRRIWILGIVGLHLGIAVFLGLGFFGLVMCLLTVAAFAIPAEPRVDGLVEHAPGLQPSPIEPLIQ